MKKELAFACLLCTARLFAADPATPPSGAAVAKESRTIAVHAKDVIPVNAQIQETTLIILPQEEKVMTVYCGDKDNWVIDGTENFVTVKPARQGAHTDVHILTDHANAYTLSFTEVSNVPGRGFRCEAVLATGRRRQPHSIAESSRYSWMRMWPKATSKRLLRRKAKAESAKKEAQQKAKQEADSSVRAIRRSCNSTIRSIKQAATKAPFDVAAIYRDDKFTYIRATPQEVPALYEIKDGQPSLINYDFANGLYTVPKILDSGYLAIGKRKMSFTRIRTAIERNYGRRVNSKTDSSSGTPEPAKPPSGADEQTTAGWLRSGGAAWADRRYGTHATKAEFRTGEKRRSNEKPNPIRRARSISRISSGKRSRKPKKWLASKPKRKRCSGHLKPRNRDRFRI